MANTFPTKVEARFCPECGLALDGIDVIAHALTHYPEYLDPAHSSKAARDNQKLLLAGGVSFEQYVDGKNR